MLLSTYEVTSTVADVRKSYILVRQIYPFILYTAMKRRHGLRGTAL